MDGRLGNKYQVVKNLKFLNGRIDDRVPKSTCDGVVESDCNILVLSSEGKKDTIYNVRVISDESSLRLRISETCMEKLINEGYLVSENS